MKVLVADKFEQSGIDGLKAAGCEVVYQPDLKDDALTQAIRETAADVLVVRGTTVTGADARSGRALARRPRRRRLQHDRRRRRVEARHLRVELSGQERDCRRRARVRADARARPARSPDNVAELRAGKWNKKEYSKARGLFGRTLGLLGYGNIGQEMARRAHAFGMPIVVWSRRFASGRGGAADAAVPDCSSRRRRRKLAERSDVLSVHLALNAETRGLVNASILDRLKPGSYFINTARGEVVDYAALRARRARSAAFASASTCSRSSRRTRPARSPIRSCRFRTCTARITSARRPIRRRKRSPPRPSASSRRTRTPARCRTS